MSFWTHSFPLYTSQKLPESSMGFGKQHLSVCPFGGPLLLVEPPRAPQSLMSAIAVAAFSSAAPLNVAARIAPATMRIGMAVLALCVVLMGDSFPVVTLVGHTGTSSNPASRGHLFASRMCRRPRSGG